MALTLVTSDLIHGLDYSKLTGTTAAGTVPTWNQNTSGTAAGLSATLVVGSGGTGVTSITALKNVLDDENWTFANNTTFSGNLTTNGVFYTTSDGPSINQNRINAGWNTTGDGIDLWINYEGYLNDVSYFRDFRVGNGKRGSAILFIDGSAGTTVFSGDVGVGSSPIASPNSADTSLSVYAAQDSSIILGDNVETWEIYQNDDLFFTYGSSPTTVLTLKRTTGNVGIGTTSTEGKLTINYTAANLPTSGTTSNSAIQVISSLNNQLNIGLNVAPGYGSYIQASDNNLAVPYSLNLQPSGGNVGIGTTSPQYPLQVKSGTNINFSISTGVADNTAVRLNAVNDAVTANIPMEFYATKFNFNLGNVGIGTTSPGSKLTVVGGTSTFVYDNSPQGTASSVYRDAVFGSTQTVNTGITIFGTGQTGIAFGDAASHIRGQVRYQHSSDTLELGAAGNLNLFISSGGDATFSNLIKTPQGIVLQGNGIPSGKTGLSSSGDGNNMRFYIGGVHTLTGMTSSQIVHEVQSTTGIRYEQNANEAVRRKEIFKAFAASGNSSGANWCRLYIPHSYVANAQGVRAEITICYHPVHASNAAYYEYVLYTSPYTAARPMYAKVRLVHQETGFGWNYYGLNNAVNFVIGDTSGNVGRYIYMNIVGAHSSYNKARSIHIVATGGENMTNLTLDTGVAAPSVSAAITIGGGPALSPG